MTNTSDSTSIAPASILTLFSAGTVRQLELTIQAAARDLRRCMRDARIAGTPKAPEACPQAARESVKDAVSILERVLQCVGVGLPQPALVPGEVPAEVEGEFEAEAVAAKPAPLEVPPAFSEMLPSPLPKTLPEIDRLYSKLSAHPPKKNQTELRQQRERLLEFLRNHRRQILQSRTA